MRVLVPPIWAVNLQRYGNTVSQLLAPAETIEGTTVRYTRGRTHGIVLQPGADRQNEVLIVDKRIQGQVSFARSIVTPGRLDAAASELDCSKGEWVKHPELGLITSFDQLQECAIRALASWADGFRFAREDPQNKVPGLRNPQI